MIADAIVDRLNVSYQFLYLVQVCKVKTKIHNIAKILGADFRPEQCGLCSEIGRYVFMTIVLPHLPNAHITVQNVRC
ncbi:MAG: hypothetical protein KBS95_00470 [Alistipes sp.]|nr:hypothetical protein [Candidatus Alistipes equi]